MADAPVSAAQAREALDHLQDVERRSFFSPDRHYATLRAFIDSAEKAEQDAARYRWLRAQFWRDAPLCVVVRPQDAVKPGRDCPSLSRLDAAIDAARSAPQDTQER